MIFKKIKINKNGFALLFVVVISSIILAVALGIADISLKEVQFSTSAKDSNDAFFAADTGIECALYWDKSYGVGTGNLPTDTAIACASSPIMIMGSDSSTSPWQTFFVPKLGYSEQGCAFVTVKKGIDDTNSSYTEIKSDGYNTGCALTSANTVERELISCQGGTCPDSD